MTSPLMATCPRHEVTARTCAVWQPEHHQPLPSTARPNSTSDVPLHSSHLVCGTPTPSQIERHTLASIGSNWQSRPAPLVLRRGTLCRPLGGGDLHHLCHQQPSRKRQKLVAGTNALSLSREGPRGPRRRVSRGPVKLGPPELAARTSTARCRSGRSPPLWRQAARHVRSHRYFGSSPLPAPLPAPPARLGVDVGVVLTRPCIFCMENH